MNIKQYFKKNYQQDILFTSSGRSALQALITDLKLKNAFMILPAFICKDVFSVLFKQNNITPVFVDCPKDSFNITLKDIKEAYIKTKNKEKIKSILIVHTFGEINKDIKQISRFCRKHKLTLIEDCAHCLNIKLSGEWKHLEFYLLPTHEEIINGFE